MAVGIVGRLLALSDTYFNLNEKGLALLLTHDETIILVGSSLPLPTGLLFKYSAKYTLVRALACCIPSCL